MKFLHFLDESDMSKKLFNMIAISKRKVDLENTADTIEKALKKKLISRKEYDSLQREINSLRKSIR